MEYILNIELKKGIRKQLTVYQGINVAEVAYNFCKENNLNFETLNHLVLEIELLLKRMNNNETFNAKETQRNNDTLK